MLLVAVILALFGIGMVFVVYGTLAKNRWGINVDPVSCPRCNTPFPPIRKPQNLRQALWGGGTCSVCGSEVDKWGRELTSREQRSLAAARPSNLPTGGVFHRKLVVFVATAFFCLTLVFDWLGFGPFSGRPSTVAEWTVMAAIAILETTIFTVLFFFLWTWLVDRVFSGNAGTRPAGGDEAAGKRGQSEEKGSA